MKRLFGNAVVVSIMLTPVAVVGDEALNKSATMKGVVAGSASYCGASNPEVLKYSEQFTQMLNQMSVPEPELRAAMDRFTQTANTFAYTGPESIELSCEEVLMLFNTGL